jgi:hypothetical protein
MRGADGRGRIGNFEPAKAGAVGDLIVIGFWFGESAAEETCSRNTDVLLGGFPPFISGWFVVESVGRRNAHCKRRR